MSHQDEWLLVAQHRMYVCLDRSSIGRLHDRFCSIASSIILVVVVLSTFKGAENRLCEPGYEPVKGVPYHCEQLQIC